MHYQAISVSESWNSSSSTLCDSLYREVLSSSSEDGRFSFDDEVGQMHDDEQDVQGQYVDEDDRRADGDRDADDRHDQDEDYDDDENEEEDRDQGRGRQDVENLVEEDENEGADDRQDDHDPRREARRRRLSAFFAGAVKRRLRSEAMSMSSSSSSSSSGKTVDAHSSVEDLLEQALASRKRSALSRLVRTLRPKAAARDDEAELARMAQSTCFLDEDLRQFQQRMCRTHLRLSPLTLGRAVKTQQYFRGRYLPVFSALEAQRSPPSLLDRRYRSAVEEFVWPVTDRQLKLRRQNSSLSGL